MGIERRQHKRLNVDFTVIYQVDKPLTVKISIGWNKVIEALMLDLSEGGMAILTEYNIPKSTVLLMKFTLINLAFIGEKRIKSMNITGEVCYNVSEKKEHRLGIRFTEIKQDDKLAIADFVKFTSFK